MKQLMFAMAAFAATELAKLPVEAHETVSNPELPLPYSAQLQRHDL